VGVGAGLYMYGVVVKTSTFAISSTDEFLSLNDYMQNEDDEDDWLHMDGACSGGTPFPPMKVPELDSALSQNRRCWNSVPPKA